MKNTTLVLIAVVVLVVLIGGYFVLYGASQSPTYVSTTPNVTPTAANSPIPQSTSLNAPVSIQNFAFNPTPLNIKTGATVTWTNNDSVPHQIKADTFNSAVLTNGQTFSFTFSTAGTYNYSCAIHPSMHGQIVVTQ